MLQYNQREKVVDFLFPSQKYMCNEEKRTDQVTQFHSFTLPARFHDRRFFRQFFDFDSVDS